MYFRCQGSGRYCIPIRWILKRRNGLRQPTSTSPITCGAPHFLGDDTALFRWAAEVMGRRLDRDRPLWECWIVDGVTNNRWAIMMKIHHAIADRIAATHILAGLSDNGVGHT